jgi:hypothetical protein
MQKTQKEKKLCFVLMPFSQEHNFPEVWEDILKKSVFNSPDLSNKYLCQRADDIFDNKSIIEDIVNIIRRSDIIIADLTTRNPNVLYELGRAHEMNKECILITQNIDDIPFDLRHLRTIIYSTSARGLTKLNNDIIKTVKTVDLRITEHFDFNADIGLKFSGLGITDRTIISPSVKERLPLISPTKRRSKHYILPIPTEKDNWIKLETIEVSNERLRLFIKNLIYEYYKLSNVSKINVNIEWAEDGSCIDQIVALVDNKEEIVYNYKSIYSDIIPAFAGSLFHNPILPFQITHCEIDDEQYYGETDKFNMKLIIQDKLPTLTNFKDSWLAGVLRLNDIDTKSEAILDIEANGSSELIPILEDYIFKNKNEENRRDVHLAKRAVNSLKSKK